MSKPDLLQTGIYTITQAAELVAAPIPLVRIWVAGRRGRQFAVIENQLGRIDGTNAVSFTNLMELRFVGLFHGAGVKLREIRSIMQEARDTLATRIPSRRRSFSAPMDAESLPRSGGKTALKASMTCALATTKCERSSWTN